MGLGRGRRETSGCHAHVVRTASACAERACTLLTTTRFPPSLAPADAGPRPTSASTASPFGPIPSQTTPMACRTGRCTREPMGAAASGASSSRGPWWSRRGIASHCATVVRWWRHHLHAGGPQTTGPIPFHPNCAAPTTRGPVGAASATAPAAAHPVRLAPHW